MKKGTFATLKSIRLVRILFYLLFASCAVLFVIFMLPQPHYTEGFKSLNELQQYAKSLDEFIKIENQNVLIPSYETYYQKKFDHSLYYQLSHRIHYLLSTFYLEKSPPFSNSFFTYILNDVLQDRLNRYWQEPFIQKIELSADSKIVIFGNIQGTFHGMVRYLEKLKDLNIIDSDLKITKPSYYFVFLGNVVNRSPFNTELLGLVLRLLKNNPFNTIVLRGRHEFTSYWKTNTLGRELDLMAQQIHMPLKNLTNMIDTFFSTLPLKLSCTIPLDNSDHLNYFEITPFVEDEKMRHTLSTFPREIYAEFLLNRSTLLSSLNLEKAQKSIVPTIYKPILTAIVTDIKKRKSYETMDGLRLLPPIDAAIAWTVFSSTAESYRNALNYFYDAFVIITPAKNLNDWTITLYNRDIRNTEKNFKTRSYYFFSGNDVGR